MRVRRTWTFLGALGWVLVAPTSRAADATAPTPDAPTTAAAPAATPASSASPASPTERLGVHLELANTQLRAELVLARIEEELGVPVGAATGTTGLRLAVQGQKLTAVYRAESGRVVERKLDLPRERQAQLDTIALLSGNLVRDEAGALLADLRAAKERARDVPPPPETAETTFPETTPAEARDAPADAPEAPEKTPETPETTAPSAAPGTDSPADESPEKEGAKLPRAIPSLTIFSPVSTNPFLAEQNASFDIGAIHSELGSLEGLSIDGVTTLNHGGGRGLSIAGIYSHTGGDFRGLRIAGLGSSGAAFTGLGITGLFSLEEGPRRGLQISGLFSYVDGPTRAAQVSLVNVATGGDFQGAQTGLVNVSPGATTGAQIGLINVGGAVNGAQIGLVNVQGENSRGAQVGLVNVGNSKHVVPVGVANVNPYLQIKPLAWASYAPLAMEGPPARPDGPLAHVGVQYLLGQFYTIVGIGTGFEENYCASRNYDCVSGGERTEDGDGILALSAGAGGRIPLDPSFFLDLDGFYEAHFSPTGDTEGRNTVAARATFGFQVTDDVALLLGGGPRVEYSQIDIWEDDPREEVAWSPTFHAGIQLF